MRVVDPITGAKLYDTYDYPYRELSASQPSFSVDWVQGSLRFDFPPYTDSPAHVERALKQDELTFASYPAAGQTNWDVSLGFPWNLWNGRLTGEPLEAFVLSDTVTVRVDSDGDGQPDKALKRVYRTPREGSDEFQLGLDPDTTKADLPSAGPRYGWIRLPKQLSLQGIAVEANEANLWVYYRWRSNGVVSLGETLAEEHPDLISAYYRTASVIDVGLSVTRTDPLATTSSQRLAPSVHMTRRVKLRNAVREIRNEP